MAKAKAYRVPQLVDKAAEKAAKAEKAKKKQPSKPASVKAGDVVRLKGAGKKAKQGIVQPYTPGSRQVCVLWGDESIEEITRTKLEKVPNAEIAGKVGMPAREVSRLIAQMHKDKDRETEAREEAEAECHPRLFYAPHISITGNEYDGTGKNVIAMILPQAKLEIVCRAMFQDRWHKLLSLGYRPTMRQMMEICPELAVEGDDIDAQEARDRLDIRLFFSALCAEHARGYRH